MLKSRALWGWFYRAAAAVGCGAVFWVSLEVRSVADDGPSSAAAILVDRCADYAFQISPAGSYVVAQQTSEGLGIATINYWSITEGSRTTFLVADWPVLNVSDRNTLSLGTLVPIDEVSMALATRRGTYVVLNAIDGRKLREWPLVIDEDQIYYSNVGGRHPTHHGHWVALPAPTAAEGFNILNVSTGELRRLRHSWSGVTEWVLGSDGSIVLRIVGDTSGESTLQIADGDDWRTVTNLGASRFRVVAPIDFTTEAEHVWVVSDLGRDGEAPGLLDLSSGRIVYADVDLKRGDLFDAQFNYDRTDLMWVVSKARASPITLSPVDRRSSSGFGASFKVSFHSERARTVYESLKQGWEHVSVLDWSADGATAIVEMIGPEGTQVDAVKLSSDGLVTDRTVLCSAPRHVDFGLPVTFASADGWSAQGRLFEPDDFDGRRFAIYLHGGPRAQGPITAAPRFQTFLDAGFAVLSVDYRGSTGYGQKYIDAGTGEFDRGMVEDVLAAREWIVNERSDGGLPVVVAVGASFGGYLAQAAVIAAPDAFDGLVSLAGVSDFNDPELRSGHDHPFIGDYLLEVLEIDRPGSAERLAAASPINHVDRISIPVLLIHGARDERAPVAQAGELARRLENLGTPVDLVVLDTDHLLDCAKCEHQIGGSIRAFLSGLSGDRHP